MESVTQVPPLVKHMLKIVEAHEGAFGQERVYVRVVALLLAEALTLARKTVTQLLLTLGLNEEDWSGWYRLFSRGSFREDKVAGVMLRESLSHSQAEDVYVVGVDGVQVARSSQKMEGTSWLKCPRTPVWKVGIHRAQRFMNGSWLLPAEQGYSRAVPLRWLPAFPDKAVRHVHEAVKEWQAAQQFLIWVRTGLDAAGRAVQAVLCLGDGSYDHVDLWQQLPERTIMLVRTAKNRVLHEMPVQHTGRGRRRKYGQRSLAPADYLSLKVGWQKLTVLVRAKKRQMTYRVEGPFLRKGAPEVPLFLIVLRGQTWQQHSTRKRRDPVYYLVNARWHDNTWQLPLPIHTLLFWAWQRWELEVSHRELKAGFGLGQKQCWNPYAAVASVQWSAWVYALLLLAAYRTWGLCHAAPSVPTRWWSGAPRWSFNTLWRELRSAFWGNYYFRPLWSAFPYNWYKKEALLLALHHASHASLRC